MENSKFYQIIKIYLKGWKGRGGGSITTPMQCLIENHESWRKNQENLLLEVQRGIKQQSVQNRIYISYLIIEWPGIELYLIEYTQL